MQGREVVLGLGCVGIHVALTDSQYLHRNTNHSSFLIGGKDVAGCGWVWLGCCGDEWLRYG